MLAEGEVDPRPLITGEVGLDGVEGAFDDLADPERHAKILINPGATALNSSGGIARRTAG
jgi:threonine dehydrogenase-like Zn-dependent dehydrogenase